ncbi:hypothetical protein [Methylobacterium sp. 37f]|uniref:hypothetical protein n=1 Tax=Methylobacterium sp. 37f TaxID=2817058 RepID=UPI001FFCE84F|nr:hypothetical protein [Methylobacterium sp. 37f]MCK2056910.1 hypothetical protein [Methylobacterium sp. 37f]
MSNPPDPAASDLKAKILSGARHASILSASERRVCIKSLFESCALAQIEATTEIFELAYGDANGSAYWAGWLTDDFSNLYQFVRLLEVHSGKAQDLHYISRSPILEALSIASRAKPPWLRFVGGEDRDLGESNHPQHLAHWEVCRGPAVRWLSQHPEFRELLPPLMAKALAVELQQEEPASPSERMTPQKLMCRDAFAALYPNGIPDKGHKSDQKLYGDVEEHIRKSGRIPPSKDTVLREAGRTRRRSK